MDTNKNTVKTIMHCCCSLLVIVSAVLAIANLLIISALSVDPDKSLLIWITTFTYLIFSFIFIITGILIPKKGIFISAKASRYFSIISLLAGLSQGKLHLQLMKGNKTIRRQWNAPAIFITGILLVILNFISIIIISDPVTIDIGYILLTCIFLPHGLVLLALLIVWFLLFIAASVWFYIDAKSRIQVPDDVIEHRKDYDNKPMVQCGSCNTVYQYDLYEGICSKCGEYNRYSENAYHLENSYKSKKSISGILKNIGLAILIFAGAIIFTLIKGYFTGKY